MSQQAGPAENTGIVGLVRSLYGRVSHLVHELGKFGVVGACAYVIDVVIYNVALSQNVETITAKTISMVIAATGAFLGNRFWTWRHHARNSLVREYLLYFGFNLVGLLISIACLLVSHYWLGSIWSAFQSKLADNISSVVIGTALASIFRFWAYRRYVFPPITQEA